MTTEPPNLADVIARIRNIPFAIAALADRCAESGSYQRELIERVYQSVRADIDFAITELRRGIKT